MNDRLRTALRELETEAPDDTAVRAAVYQGIDTRARRKRLSTIVGAAATVAALGAVAVSVGGGEPNPPTGARSEDRLVPVVVPQPVLPVDPREVADGRKPQWISSTESVQASYNERPPLSITAHITAKKRPTFTSNNDPGETTRTTVSGHSAWLTIIEDEHDPLAYVTWQLPSGVWMSVETFDPDYAVEAANKLLEREVTGAAELSVRLAPPGYRVDGPFLSNGTGPKSHAVQFMEMPNGFTDGPQPPNRRGCADPRWAVGPNSKPLAAGPPVHIGNVRVRLGSDGCSAVRINDDGSKVIAVAQEGGRITPRELGRIVATATVIPPG